MSTWISEVSDYIDQQDYDAVNAWMATNHTKLFEPEPLSEIHTVLGTCDMTQLNVFSKLIKAWIAFIFGDNIALTQTMRSLQQNTFDDPKAFALHEDLYALLGDLYKMSPDEKLEKGLAALNILSDDRESLFYANANLTLGQIYSERNAFSIAVSYFKEAHAVFDALNCVFLAIISEVNMLLNLYKLGAYQDVIDASERAQIRSSRFLDADSRSDLLAVYHLPMGMALVELEKLDLALAHLQTCKKSIDALKMFHLHGLIEWMVLKVYYKKKAYEDLKQELKMCRETFSSLSSPLIEAIFDYYEILAAHDTNESVDPVKAERLSLTLSKQKDSQNFILVEMMATLQAKEKNKSDLSSRELEILEGVAQGKTNDEIGKMLYISTGTVKWHLNNIYSKLEVKNRVQALEKYRQDWG